MNQTIEIKRLEVALKRALKKGDVKLIREIRLALLKQLRKPESI